MEQIILQEAKLITFTENRAGLLIYPAETMRDIAMLEKLSAQASLLKCTELDCLLKRTPDVINWLENNTPKRRIL